MLSFLPRLNNDRPGFQRCRNKDPLVSIRMVRDSGLGFRLTFCNDIGRLVSFPWHYCPISSARWKELFIHRHRQKRLVGLCLSTWFFWIRSPDQMFGRFCDMERRSLSSSSYSGSQIGAGDSILIMTLQMWRPNPDLQLASVVTPWNLETGYT